MHYVKQFTINGVDTKQVACIELQGVPNAATEGAVGVLGMDMTSPTHEVYRCVAVNGSVYTWELLSAGMSIINAIITREGAEKTTFRYVDLKIPSRYIIKVGDLIIDSEGYLYQIDALGNESCDASYCGTHIGGIASGDKDFRLIVKDGQIQLVTESGNVLSSIDNLSPDELTIHRDNSTGKASVMGVRTVNGTLLRFFVGTKEVYDTLTEAQKQNLFAIFTEDTTREDFLKALDTLDGILEGRIVVGKAERIAPQTIDWETIDIYTVKARLEWGATYLIIDGWSSFILHITEPKETPDGIIWEGVSTASYSALSGYDSNETGSAVAYVKFVRCKMASNGSVENPLFELGMEYANLKESAYRILTTDFSDNLTIQRLI